ncbi:MAG: CvpA family protein [Candidatus Izimaplasma sp.]|nr:CvpA family protein [Candidatus Izimaplasma bacterium]
MNILNLFGLIDILIVFSVIAMIILGWKKGFLLKIVEIASGLFGLIASLLLARTFSKVLDSWFGEGIEERIRNYFLETNPNLINNLTEDSLETALQDMSMPDFIVSWISNSVNYDEAAMSIIDGITPMLKSLVLLVLAFVSLFIGSMIIFFFLKILSRLITKIPVIKQVDKFLGALFGLFKAAMIIFTLLLLLSLALAIPAINNLIADFVLEDMQLDTESFRLSKWLYNNNIFRFIINIFAAVFR